MEYISIAFTSIFSFFLSFDKNSTIFPGESLFPTHSSVGFGWVCFRGGIKSKTWSLNWFQMPVLVMDFRMTTSFLMVHSRIILEQFFNRLENSSHCNEVLDCYTLNREAIGTQEWSLKMQPTQWKAEPRDDKENALVLMTLFNLLCLAMAKGCPGKLTSDISWSINSLTPIL